MSFSFSRCFLLTALLLLGSSLTLHAQPTAIVGGTVHPVSGPVIEDGVVLLEGDRIAAVGRRGEVPIPSQARRVDANGMVVTPGLIDASTATGLIEVGSLSSTRDNALRGDPIRAAFRVTDGINPHSTVIPVTRLGGVTTVAATPSGGAIAGQSAVIDLIDGPLSAMLVRDGAGLYATFTPDGADAVGGGRGGLSLRLREAFEDARFYRAQRDAFARGATRSVAASRLDLAALLPVLDGDIPLVMHAARASDISASLRIADEYGVHLVIEGGHEAWMRADALAQSDTPVILKPLSNLPTEFDRLGTRFDNAARLAEAGVPIVLSTMDTHNARNLRFEAGNAVRFGLDREAALEAITLAPARVLGIAESHGTLEAGKMANVVVWSGDPFEFSTAPAHIFIRGTAIPNDSRQQRLLDRYRTLDGSPPQYKR
jgi:imidazolonepropionase-like amidohydrolase